MLEVEPVLATVPVVKPRKIERDNGSAKRQQHRKKQDTEKPTNKPSQHIDEIV